MLTRNDFLLDPDVVFLNHGSFGAVPRAVQEQYEALQRAMERNPVEFLGRRSAGLLRAARERLAAFATDRFGGDAAAVRFEGGRVGTNGGWHPFEHLVAEAYLARVQLWSEGFYATPGLHWDKATLQGRPFFYFAYGAALSEVIVDTLTGETRVLAADLLHDVGRSLNPAIDIGQIEGAFVQGMGWLTTEELWWDAKGRLRTHAPSTYKIPVASDRPRVFNVRLAEWSENREPTIKRSKAVGEPPFMLAISVLEALSMAAASVADYRIAPRMDAPATPERVLATVTRLRAEAGA